MSRAAQLQIVQGGRWQEQVQSQTTETVPLPATRGAIYDRNGKATSAMGVDAAYFRDDRELEEKYIFDMEYWELEQAKLRKK